MHAKRTAIRFALLLTTLAAAPALAHVTPNVELVKKGEFVRQALPGAAKILEQQLGLGTADLSAIHRSTGWTPSEEDVKIYVGRDAKGALLGTVMFLWIPSEHGPVGVGVVFDGTGTVTRIDVTDVGSEPLAWVRPLLAGNGLAALAGLPLSATPDPSKIAPAVKGSLSRYYAKVITDGVARAQAIERASLAIR